LLRRAGSRIAKSDDNVDLLRDKIAGERRHMLVVALSPQK
jgi:hypothetical protein